MSADENVNVTDSLRRSVEIAQSFILGLEKRIKPYYAYLDDFSKRLKQWLADNEELIKTLPEVLEKWGLDQKRLASESAIYGWFPNAYTWKAFLDIDFAINDSNIEKLDIIMINHFDEYWVTLTSEVLSAFTQRRQVLEVAFELHENGNYFASIPILIAQSDGIMSESFKSFFYKDNKTGRRAAEEILYLADENELIMNSVTDLFLEPLRLGNKLQITKGSSKATNTLKGPNRHGILHGSRKHLDYGTRINGYKAFSFLAYVVFVVTEGFRKVDAS